MSDKDGSMKEIEKKTEKLKIESDEEQKPKKEKKEKKTDEEKKKKEKKEKEDDRLRLHFVVEKEGSYGTHPKDFSKAVVLESHEDCVKVGLKNDQIPSKFDFTSNFLLYIASGQKPTGGYSIKPKRIYQKKKGSLEIFCADKEPHGDFGTMAFTQPWILLKVEKPEKEIKKKECDVAWMDKKK
eukprot:gene3274-5717_t